MNKKGNIGAIVAICAVIALFAGVVIWRVIDKSQSANNYDVNSVITANADNGEIADHVKGDLEKAKVIIFEYADFQCEACALHNPRVNKLVEEYDGDLAVVYRNYLLSYHKNGTAAASAAEAAGLQGYWKEYADKLFTNQSVWSSASGDERTQIFVNFFNAVSNGQGDEAKFKKDMTSEAVKKKLNFDSELGNRVNIEGTPTFYLNGEKIDFSGSKGEEGWLNVFREKIDEALKK
ncbi:thioredoxin domain-containing protein [Candidatus Saccharibacteria bacterium]|nr:thioredoxin domain-containing protein [Candidatus Saccharibacteria bacterium]